MCIMRYLEYVMCLFLLAELSFISVQIGLMYSSPIAKHDTDMFYAAHALLDCGRHQIPEKRIMWNLLDVCIDQSNIRKVRAGKMPYIFRDKNTLAWVLKYIDRKTMFTTPKYDQMSPIEKAYVVIHECTHLALNSNDHAYYWQTHFKNLTKEQHANNADSIAMELFRHCGYYVAHNIK